MTLPYRYRCHVCGDTQTEVLTFSRYLTREIASRLTETGGPRVVRCNMCRHSGEFDLVQLLDFVMSQPMFEVEIVNTGAAK